MAFSKIIMDGVTLMDVTQKTVTAATLFNGETALGADGEDVVGEYTPGTVIVTDTVDAAGGTIRKIAVSNDALLAEPLNITQNGTYTALSGHTYSQVVANVAGTAQEPYITEVYDNQGNLISAALHGATKVRSNFFNSESYLQSVSIPDTVTSIGDYAFSNCESLSLSSLPSGLTTIGASAFSWSGISISSIPSGVTELLGYTFNHCTGITSITIPAGVVRVNDMVFGGCSNLTTVTFLGTPSNGIAYGDWENAFYNCTAITDMYVPWAEGAVVGAPWGATNATIHYNWTP